MIGLCCHYLEENKKNKIENILNEKNLQYSQYLKGKYSEKQIVETWINNANGLIDILKKVNNEGIKLFRISSNLFPLYDNLTNVLKSNKEISDLLKEAGKFILSNNMRVSTHPDQFVVLSSNKTDVIEKSIRMLNHHAWIFDEMELPISPFYAINIHGGTKGNIKILINSIKLLPKSTSGRLTLENDESSYSIKDLLVVYEECGIPICWDSHHHTFNPSNLSLEDALKICKTSWGNIKPLTHLSNTSPEFINGSFTDRRKHSDYVHYIPDCQLIANNNNEIDIEFEFKMKNLAIKKAVQDFKIKI